MRSNNPGLLCKIVIIPLTNVCILLSEDSASEKFLEKLQPPIDIPNLNVYFSFAAFNAPRFPLCWPIGFSKSALL
jgi:hypothetical protein